VAVQRHFGTANIIIAKIFIRKYFANDGTEIAALLKNILMKNRRT
jgi:hypothetical protein